MAQISEYLKNHILDYTLCTPGIEQKYRTDKTKKDGTDMENFMLGVPFSQKGESYMTTWAPNSPASSFDNKDWVLPTDNGEWTGLVYDSNDGIATGATEPNWHDADKIGDTIVESDGGKTWTAKRFGMDANYISQKKSGVMLFSGNPLSGGTPPPWAVQIGILNGAAPNYNMSIDTIASVSMLGTTSADEIAGADVSTTITHIGIYNGHRFRDYNNEDPNDPSTWIFDHMAGLSNYPNDLLLIAELDNPKVIDPGDLYVAPTISFNIE